MTSLQDLSVVITGASSGIGDATARLLAKEGARVVLAARRADRLEALKADIEASGGTALVVETDVTDRAQCEALIQAAMDAYGRIDVLINNAGVMPLSLAESVRMEEWMQMVDVNINGVLYCTGAAIPHMISQEAGHIVNVSSVAGRRLFFGGSVYCATKHAITAFSEGLRMELGPRHGIRVTCIEPGAVSTELFQAIEDPAFKEAAPEFKATPIAPEDIAESIRYAVSAPSGATVAEVLVMPTDQVR
ncbi:SDR family oxidoreductase [Rubricoccus marinus]|uniref:Oxidoreductase n=1 Tax=Rubricoccus marinus TaxID=716817 RepID=A0A259U210_9BACT|nr:SDR family oxidoreductase [Rubricoccus marinus]OZC04001.1 oxidoreductase [Rubricoccus marinus]